jgi:branched-subunit amino acid transport protein
LWLTILAIGIGTFCLRLSFIHLLARASIPALLQQALRFVPPAVLAALVLPTILRSGGAIDVSPDNVRLVAGALAAGVAWWTRNVLLTLATGMGALWLFNAIM